MARMAKEKGVLGESLSFGQSLGGLIAMSLEGTIEDFLQTVSEDDFRGNSASSDLMH
jgi:hypothetical protein